MRVNQESASRERIIVSDDTLALCMGHQTGHLNYLKRNELSKRAYLQLSEHVTAENKDGFKVRFGFSCKTFASFH